jgi:selenoprotein W-related protein
MLDRATDLQTALLETYGEQLDAVALVTGDSGVFKVAVDGDQIYDKDDEEYDADTIVDRVGEHV